MKIWGGTITGFLCAMLLSLPAQATSVYTAHEQLWDAGSQLFDRELRRERWSSTGFLDLSTNELAIVAEHDMLNFGLYNAAPVHYRHDLSWLSPLPDAYAEGRLTIRAFGVDVGNDPVLLDLWLPIGPLNLDGSPSTSWIPFAELRGEGLTDTTFLTTNQPLLQLLLNDNQLHVSIIKTGPALPNDPFDEISIVGSRLEVTYHVVPAPVAVGAGLTMLALVGLRRGRGAAAA